MTGWLYLIRNRDLYKIGITKNLENRMRQLKPDSVVAKLYSSDYVKLEKELHSRYKNVRIPQTEYFRLDPYHLTEIKLRISRIENSLIIEIFFKTLLLLVFAFIVAFLLISLYINDLNAVLLQALLFIEKISLFFSFISLFFNSGKYLSFLNEFKYRSTRSLAFILFALLINIAKIFLNK